MVFGGFALAAIFAACFLLTSHLARRSKEESEDLQDEIILAQAQRKQVEAALAQAKLEYARQGGQMEALQDRVRQHNEMNQALRDALAEADAQAVELRKKLMAEVARNQQLSDRLAAALAAMNDISQAIIDMAERHRSSVQRLLEPAALPDEQPVEPVSPAALSLVAAPPPDTYPALATAAAPDDGDHADGPSQAPAHDRPPAAHLAPQGLEAGALA